MFRGILLGSIISSRKKLSGNFYVKHDFSKIRVFDPFMGSGTTIGEAHKLGLCALGRDINPVAAELVRIALGPMDRIKIDRAFKELEINIGQKLLQLYRSVDSSGNSCEVLYYFWVMQVNCPVCKSTVDLFSSWIVARNAYPKRKPEVQVLCPRCGDIFKSINGKGELNCKKCNLKFRSDIANVNRSKATCSSCNHMFHILKALDKRTKPKYRLYGKLVLTKNQRKEYLKATKEDLIKFKKCSVDLVKETRNGSIAYPNLKLEAGYNTNQVINYGFKNWKEFFNDRQLLGLGRLYNAILAIYDTDVRDLFLLAFSGALEFNNMFASYKGEGTGAVRHMFSHHILKPERTPIEANIWGTPKSSGSFSNLFRNRVDRAIKYRQNPTEISAENGSKGIVSSASFVGEVEKEWPVDVLAKGRKIYLSCGDSSISKLQPKSIDLIVTDPPFFDNVHYSELADFFYSWQKLMPRGFIKNLKTTRSKNEVQDAKPKAFEDKLKVVFQECYRILTDEGLLVFTYHHSRYEGWQSVASSIINSGFYVVNTHPVKSEMSVAAPKSQAKEPIQIDIIIVCRKKGLKIVGKSPKTALKKAISKINRLQSAGFSLSLNDKKAILYGQLLSCMQNSIDPLLMPNLIKQDVLSGQLLHAEISLKQEFKKY